MQAARDEGYEVDEGLAEQDAGSLFEVRPQKKSARRSSFKLDTLFAVPFK